jgi:hypothetical protein
MSTCFWTVRLVPANDLRDLHDDERLAHSPVLNTCDKCCNRAKSRASSATVEAYITVVSPTF